MKSYLALALFAGVVIGLASGNASTSYYAWAPNKELTYRFESQVLTGIPNLKEQYAGLKMSSDVIIQTNSDYSLRIKFREPKFVEANEDVEVIDGQPQIKKAIREVPEELKAPLTTPFVVHFKRGAFEALYVEKSEPAVVTNIKKALVTQLQLDLTASGRKDILSPNSISKSGSDSDNIPPRPVADDHSYFTTEETSVAGDCQTSYTFHPLPKYQAVEVEQRIESNYHKLKAAGIISGERSEGDEICRGKEYFEITKTKHFDNCRQRPSYQSIRGVKVDCDYTKAECKELMTQMSSSRYIVCGTPREFYIREAQTSNEIVTNPLSWSFTSEERMVLTAKVTLMLLKVKSKTEAFPEPRNAERKKSLIYEFPRGDLWSSVETREIISGEENDKRGYQPILPMPDMRSGSGLLPKFIPTKELTKKIVEEMEKIVREIFESPESCPSKADVAGYVHAIAQSLRPRNLQELEEIDRAVMNLPSLGHNDRKIAKELWHDIVAMTGTNACFSLIKRKVESGEIRGAEATRVLQSVIRNIKTPTQELLGEMLNLVKSLRSSQRPVYNVVLIQLANLFQHACVDPTQRTTQFPVRTYGLFCHRDSEVLAKRFIPYLVKQLEASNEDSSKDKLIYIAALGKIGSKEVVIPLAKVIEENTSPMVRSVAVYSLKRVATLEPSVVRPILLKLIDNPADVAEVRIAAIAVLPWTQPSTAQLQKVAVRTWFEPSKQVASFMFSTLRSLTATKVPELVPVGLKAKGLETLVKPFNYGMQFSHSLHTQKFVEYLRTLSSVETSYVNTAESLVPARFSVSNQLYGGAWQIDGLTFSLYTNGMEHLVDKIIAFYDYESTTSHTVKEELAQLRQGLNIKPKATSQRQQRESFVRFSLLGMHRVYSMNQDPISEILEKVAEEMRSGNGHGYYEKEKNFNMTYTNYAIRVRVLLPSMSGFPVVIRRNLPFVAAIKGDLYYKMEPGMTGSVLSGTVLPVINGKLQSSMGVISPFEKRFVGAGVEASLHYSLALTARVEIPKRGEVSVTFKSPKTESRKELEALHAFVTPFTVIKKLERMVPLTKAGDFKEIVSGEGMKTVHMPLGRSVGIDARLKMEANYRQLDFPLLWEKLSQHNVFSVGSLVYMPVSARKASLKIEFNPSASETKEIKANFYMVSGKKMLENNLREVHFPSMDDLNENRMEEAKRLCRNNNVRRNVRSSGSDDNEYSPDMCEASVLRRHHSYRTAHGHVNDMLERSTFVRGVNIDATLVGGDRRHKTVQTTVLVGGENKDQDYKSFLEVKIRTPQQSSGAGYELDVKAEAKLPEMPYRWDVQSMIKESLKMDAKVDIGYKFGSGEKKEIRLAAILSKSEHHKEAVRRSPEMQKCEEEIAKGRELSSVCVEARHQAASVDKITLKADIPKSWRQSRIVNTVESYVESYLWPVMAEEDWSRHSGERDEEYERRNRNGGDYDESSSSYSYEFEALVNRTGTVAQAWVRSPYTKLHFRNVTLTRSLRGIFPMSLRNGIALRVVQKATGTEVPASCRVEEKLISTFDNRTYEYKLGSCGEHLLFKDCSAADLRSKIPAAVTTKQSQSSPAHQDVKILSGENKVELKYQSGGIEVVVNGQRQEIQAGQTYTKTSKSQQMHRDTVVLQIHRYRGDSVIRVENPRQGLSVFYDGQKIEIVAPQLLHNRACGLCGDLNGENTADLKSAEECVMRHPRFAAYSYMTGGDRCVPEEDRTEYAHEKRECLKQKFIRTRVEELARRLVTRRQIPVSAAHVVEVTQNNVCISKTMVRVCGKNQRPVKMERVELSFACLTRGYSKTHQIIKRANAGEQIIQVREMPTEFSKKHMQPVECKTDYDNNDSSNRSDESNDSSEERNGSGSSQEVEEEIERIEEKLQRIRSKVEQHRGDKRSNIQEIEQIEKKLRWITQKNISGRKMQQVERIERELRKLKEKISGGDEYVYRSGSNDSSEEEERKIEKIEEQLQGIRSKINERRGDRRTHMEEIEQIEREVRQIKNRDLSGRKMEQVERIEKELRKLKKRVSNEDVYMSGRNDDSSNSSEEEEQEIEQIQERLERLKRKVEERRGDRHANMEEAEKLERRVRQMKSKDLSGSKKEQVERIEKELRKLKEKISGGDEYVFRSGSNSGRNTEEEREIERLEQKLQRIKSKIFEHRGDRREFMGELEQLEREARQLKEKDLSGSKRQHVEEMEREIRKLKKRVSNDDNDTNTNGSGSSEEEKREIERLEEKLQRIKSKVYQNWGDRRSYIQEVEEIEREARQLKEKDLSGRKQGEVIRIEKQARKLKEKITSGNDSNRSSEETNRDYSDEESQERRPWARTNVNGSNNRRVNNNRNVNRNRN